MEIMFQAKRTKTLFGIEAGNVIAWKWIVWGGRCLSEIRMERYVVQGVDGNVETGKAFVEETCLYLWVMWNIRYIRGGWLHA